MMKYIGEIYTGVELYKAYEIYWGWCDEILWIKVARNL